MTAPDQSLRELLAAFEKDRDPDRLYQAIEAGNRASRDAQEREREWLEARKPALLEWLSLLSEIEGGLDPAFDPGKVPQPPPALDPAAEADPAARAAHAQAVDAARERIERHQRQLALREFEQRAQGGAERFVGGQYPHADRDRAELDDSLTRAAIAGPRRERLRAALPPPSRGG